MEQYFYRLLKEKKRAQKKSCKQLELRRMTTWGAKSGGVDTWAAKAQSNDPTFTSLTVLPMR